jgi:hypothetical protein
MTHPTTHTAPVSPPPPRHLTIKDFLGPSFPDNTPRLLAVVGTIAILAGAALVAATAAIHLHLWLAGYRHVPRIGPLFLAQAVTGFALAPVLALGRHLAIVLGAALYMAASAAGLLLSATVGFLGIHDGLGVPWAAPSLTVELTGMVLLGGAGAVAIRRLIARRGPTPCRSS